ncbi:MAG: hypothetical protein LBR22_03650 [Desulfovibrio sp.]|jgi:hypothetical protein|nr:hypothetical protein [Desulfovibrio sp.]
MNRYFFSADRHSVEINGEKRIVCYTEHAIDRIYKRIYGVNDFDIVTFAQVKFSAIENLSHFEMCKVTKNGEPMDALVIYWCVRRDSKLWNLFVPEVIAPDPDKNKQLYRKVGYCPLSIPYHSNLAVVKTILSPGMNGTPEYDLINWHENRAEAERLKISKEKIQSPSEILQFKDLSALKFFQKHRPDQFFFSKDNINRPKEYNPDTNKKKTLVPIAYS